MTNMSIQPLWFTHFIEILLVLEFQLKIFIIGTFSYKAHFRPQISSNACGTREDDGWKYKMVDSAAWMERVAHEHANTYKGRFT